MNHQLQLRDCFAGILLGTAIGDALGLPAEGLSRSRIRRRWQGQWRHRFFFRHGMCSDDTEHTFFVAQALLSHPDDPVAFQKCLAWKLRLWLLGLPAGVGLATLRSILKLWLGFPPSKSGVFSAGNGPAMRSALLGAYFFDDPLRRKHFVSAATRLTHTDPRAETAALAIAEAAAWAMRRDTTPRGWAGCLAQLSNDPEWSGICRNLLEALAQDTPVTSFADSVGCKNGVSGYAFHSVPVALYAWLRSPENFREALTSALDCGGDVDTVGAMVGALAGASAGPKSIPTEWLDHIAEWPRSKRVLLKAADRLAAQKESGRRVGPVTYFWPGLVPRNLLFLFIVLTHGFRRLIP